MNHPLDAVRFGRNIEWAAIDGRFPFGPLDTVDVAIVFPDAPSRVIRRRGNNTDVVPVSREPGTHLTGIFANSRQLRLIVEAINKNAH